MARLKADIVRELKERLTPIVGDNPSSRQAFLFDVFGDHPILDRIDWSGNTDTYTGRLMISLWDYGTVDGVPALRLLLDVAKTRVGEDKAALIEQTAARISWSTASPSPTPPAVRSNANQPNTTISSSGGNRNLEVIGLVLTGFGVLATVVFGVFQLPPGINPFRSVAASPTIIPTSTSTPSPTLTLTPTLTVSPTTTSTDVPTATDVLATQTLTPTLTDVPPTNTVVLISPTDTRAPTRTASPVPSATPTMPTMAVPFDTANALNALNDFRDQRGLAPLVVDETLDTFSEWHINVNVIPNGTGNLLNDPSLGYQFPSNRSCDQSLASFGYEGQCGLWFGIFTEAYPTTAQAITAIESVNPLALSSAEHVAIQFSEVSFNSGTVIFILVVFGL